MTTPDPKMAIVRQLVEAFNEKDRERLMACYSTDLVVHASDGSTRSMDHEEHWAEVERMYEVFPDVSAEIHHMIADDRSVFLRGAYTATHTGSLEQSVFEPTGRSATWAWWCEYRFRDGVIVDAWNIYDTLSRLEQHGHWTPPQPRTG